MNKKAAALPMEKLIGIIILVVFLAVVAGAFFRPEKGWLNAIADKAESFARFIPGRDKVPHVPGLEISEDIVESVEYYCDEFKKLLTNNYDDQKCLLKIPLLPDLQGTTVTISNTEKGIYLKLLNKEHQVDLTCSVEDENKRIQVCAIVGNTEVENFYNNYLRDPTKIGSESPEYLEVANVAINYEGFDYNEHGIVITTKSGRTINHELETNKGVVGNVNILYKPDEDHICYIPTEDGYARCRPRGEVLDDDCLTDEDEYILRSLSECGQNSFLKLVDVFEQSKEEKSNCIRYYPIQHEIQKRPKQDKIVIEQNGNDIIFELFSKDGKIMEEKVENKKLCTISSYNNNTYPARNFFKYLFNKLDSYEPEIKFSEVNKIEIFYERTDSNYYDLDIQYKNGLWKRKLELQDSNILFQADKDHLCFIPSTDVYNYHRNGIEDGYIAKLRDENNRENYRLPLCSEI